MKKSSIRRVPRKIGTDNDDKADTAAATGSLVQRPSLASRKPTAARTSFAQDPEEIHDGGAPSVVKPKRGNISRLAVQRNAAQRAYDLPPRAISDNNGDDRPSYGAAALQELRDSTPSTPQTLSAIDDGIQLVAQETQALDLSSKFGETLARYQQPSAIPSAAEIAEKKARRARLAKEQQAEEYMSLDLDDPGLDEDENDNVMTDERGRLVLKPKDKYNQAESRLVHDDEDIMENFDAFTEDGKIHLGRKAQQEAHRKRREEMAAQIAAAEGSGSDAENESDESENERNAAFEAAQTRHGTYGTTGSTPADPYEHLRPRTPPKIKPLPTLDGVIERLRRQLSEIQASRARRLQEMEALQREKIRLAEEEVRIQRALRETEQKFRLLREEKGLSTVSRAAIEAPKGLLDERAVEEGETEGVALGDGGNEDEAKEVNGEENGAAGGMSHAGLGFGGVSSTAGLGSGMAGRPSAEDDW